ncbi:ABC transporter ATP-binding protein [Natrialbaceae archaeon A-chndr2]
MSWSRSDPIMQIENLEKHYPLSGGLLSGEVGRVKAVDGISFDIHEGETFGIVGESGCGKSTAATSMIRLEEPTGGQVRYKGEDITEYDSTELKRFRRNVQMIFQDPDSSFDPRMSIGDAVAEPLIVQGMSDRKKREAIVADLLERVGLSASDMARYPHEFSGGQKQRIGLARALAVNPDVIVADEPVSALDVSIQSEILQLMKELQEAFNLTIIVISHNLGVIREICDRVAVMYLGEFVEVADSEELFNDPQHPYTRALLSAIPTPDPRERGLGVELKGDVPDPSAPPSGCRFHTRCPEVIPPEDLELSQSVWRDVLHFRQRVRDGTLNLDSVAETAAVEEGIDTDDIDGDISVDDMPAETVISQLRRENDLPAELTDTTANETLDKAFDQLAQGNLEGANEILEESFMTVCERDAPALTERAGRQVSCHLHDDVKTDGSLLEADQPVSD